jgi:hypothetical protein
VTVTDTIDQVTGAAKQALDILFLANPTGSSLGVLTGVVCHGLLGLVGPFLTSVEWLALDTVKLAHLIALGVLVFNLPSYSRRHRVDPKIEEALLFIQREASKGNIPKWQQRIMYENLFNRVLQSVTLEGSTATHLREVRESLTNASENKP